MKNPLAAVFLGGLCAASLYAQDAEPAAVTVQEIPRTDEIGISDEGIEGAAILSGRVSLNLKDVELQDVIRLFSRLSNANIIVPDLGRDVASRQVDVNLSGVEWKSSLQAILDTNGLELYEKIPGTEVYSVRVRPVDAPEPLAFKTFHLKYATVASVNELIRGLVPERGKIALFASRNMIVVQSTASSLADIEKIINVIDLPRQQVFIEAKFMELSDSASDQLGIDWQILGGSDGGYRVGASNLAAGYSKTSTRTRGSFGGVTNSASAIETAASLTGEDSGLFQEVPGKKFTQTIKTTTALLSADDFSLVLAALKEINGAKVVSNPKIIVANEETASIHIGQKKPNVKGTTTTSGDTQIVRTYELDNNEPYFEDGIRVDVTPTINTEDNITVNIQPTLDRLDTVPMTADDGTEFYGKTTKTINTTFGLHSGQTAAIGGLTEISNSDVDRRIPLLGRLPLLGRFFSYSSKSKRQTETIIFVTVGLANPENISFETGLPEDASLARRYHITDTADRAVTREQIKLLETQENERSKQEIQTLRAAEKQRLMEKTDSAKQSEYK
jgi:type IV pilus assembly protein PilQ